MAQKSLLEHACLDSSLFAFVGRVGQFENATVPKEQYVRIYSSKDAPIMPGWTEPAIQRALFVGTERDAVRFACARAAQACRDRVATYRAQGEEHNAAVSARFAQRYADLAAA